MVEYVSWVRVASFGSGIEAEMALAKLRANGIFAITRSHDIAGVFGAAFQGFTPRGVDVFVGSDDLRDAADLLDETAEPLRHRTG